MSTTTAGTTLDQDKRADAAIATMVTAATGEVNSSAADDSGTEHGERTRSTREVMQVTKKSDVDPAALLIAIIAVAVTPLTTPGPWDKLNTAVALIVLIVLWAYTIGSHRRDSLESFGECSAIGLVMGLIFAISIAWPIQFFWTWAGKTNDKPDFVAADYSTWSGLALGLVTATVLTIFLWKKPRAPKGTLCSIPRSEPLDKGSQSTCDGRSRQ